jgi:hypothetical protein
MHHNDLCVIIPIISRLRIIRAQHGNMGSILPMWSSRKDIYVDESPHKSIGRSVKSNITIVRQLAYVSQCCLCSLEKSSETRLAMWAPVLTL